MTVIHTVMWIITTLSKVLTLAAAVAGAVTRMEVEVEVVVAAEAVAILTTIPLIVMETLSGIAVCFRCMNRRDNELVLPSALTSHRAICPRLR